MTPLDQKGKRQCAINKQRIPQRWGAEEAAGPRSNGSAAGACGCAAVLTRPGLRGVRALVERERRRREREEKPAGRRHMPADA